MPQSDSNKSEHWSDFLNHNHSPRGERPSSFHHPFTQGEQPITIIRTTYFGIQDNNNPIKPPVSLAKDDSVSFKPGSTELYVLIATIITIMLILGCMVYYFFFKKSRISMERNRRAKVRPISRRVVRKNTKPKAPDSPDAFTGATNNQEVSYAEIQIDPFQQPRPQPEPNPPRYEDLRETVRYAQIDIR